MLINSVVGEFDGVELGNDVVIVGAVEGTKVGGGEGDVGDRVVIKAPFLSSGNVINEDKE